jgi:hypothetical protein
MIAFNQIIVFHQAAMDMNLPIVAKTPYITMPAFAPAINPFKVFATWNLFRRDAGEFTYLMKEKPGSATKTIMDDIKT